MQGHVDGIIRSLSAERFRQYRLTAVDDGEALGRYVWNTRLSEALYPAVHCLEVAFRNAVHAAGAARFPGGAWRDLPSWIDRQEPVLFPDEVAAVEGAKARVRKQHRALEPGRVIAELNFGFWTALLDVRYEQTQTLWPHLLASVFPHLERRRRTRRTVSARFNRIRILRNRISHHEPIWHWTDLSAQHAQMVEALGWISPSLVSVLSRIDRFDEVFGEGWMRFAPGRVTPMPITREKPDEG